MAPIEEAVVAGVDGVFVALVEPLEQDHEVAERARALSYISSVEVQKTGQFRVLTLWL